MRITMTGADGEHFANATALNTRLLPFPDGITRHIALTERQWEVFDGWRHDGTDMQGFVLQMVDEFAAKFGPPEVYEDHVRLALQRLIVAAMPDYSAYPRPKINDN